MAFQSFLSMLHPTLGSHNVPQVLKASVPEQTALTYGFEEQAAYQARADAAAASGASMGRFVSTQDAPLTHGVAPQSLEGLQPILLCDLLLEMNRIHVGRVLYLTAVGTRTIQQIGVQVLVEDATGIRLRLALYNYVPPGVEPDEIFPRGTRLALLEPYPRFFQDNPTDDPMLRCDNPQAVRIFSDQDSWDRAQQGDFSLAPKRGDEFANRSVDQLIEEGNAFYCAGMLTKAAGMYSAAVEKDPKCARALSNRAQCYMSDERWSLALEDCESALKIAPSYSKCVFRKCRALLFLQEPKAALEAAKGLVDSSTDRNALKNLKVEINRAIKEQMGQYDLMAMKREAYDAGSGTPRGVVHELSRLHPDFENGNIEVVETAEKGRCVNATDDIPGGALLMASKAFAIECAKVNSLPLLSFGADKSCNSGSQVNVLPKIVQKLMAQPERSQELYSLRTGDSAMDLDSPYIGAIDVPRVRAILKNNWFGGGDERSTSDEAVRSMRYLEKSGQFGNDGLQPENVGSIEADIYKSTGLWIRPSFFNHSCSPNCAWYMIGDFLFISTRRDVKAGEELCIQYCDPLLSFSERTKKFSKWGAGGFECRCQRCVASRACGANVEALESMSNEMFESAAKLAHCMPLGEAARSALGSNAFRLRNLLEKLNNSMVSGIALAQILELEGAVLLEDVVYDKAVSKYERAMELRATVLGEYGSWSFVSDNIRVAFASLLAGKREGALEALGRAFRVACLGKWAGPPMAVPDFKAILQRYQVGEDLFAVMKMQDLVEEVNKSTGFLAIQERPPFCAYCIDAWKNLLRCKNCGEYYCSVEHQKKHWVIHKRGCKPRR